MNSLKSVLVIFTIISFYLVACDDREDAFGFTTVPYIPDTIPNDTNPNNPLGKAPIANFTAKPTSTIVGQSVQFTDKSTNKPSKWQWDFGDKTTSADSNPKHIYNTVGTYNVTLTVENKYGKNDTTITNCIKVTEKPAIDVFTSFVLRKAEGTLLERNSQYEYYITVKAGIENKFKYSFDEDSCQFKLTSDSDKEDFGISPASQTITYNGYNSESSLVSIDIITPKGEKKDVKMYMSNNANLLPIPKIQISHKFEAGKGYIVTFDASTSFDQDAGLGGKIIEYQLIFGTLIDKKQSSAIFVDTIVNGGKYYYTLKVRDNNGVLGNELSNDYTLE